MKSTRGSRTHFAVAFVSLLGLNVLVGCGTDDATGVNDCDIVTRVTNVRDSYFVGETISATVTYNARNPSASCANSIVKKVVKLGSSDPSVAAATPSSQFIAIAPGKVTLIWGPDTAQPFSHAITVMAAVQLKE